MSTARRNRKSEPELLAQIEHDESRHCRLRDRRAEIDAERFWAAQQGRSSQPVQIFGPTQTERDADREIRLSALRDRIRIVSREELDRL